MSPQSSEPGVGGTAGETDVDEQTGTQTKHRLIPAMTGGGGRSEEVTSELRSE